MSQLFLDVSWLPGLVQQVGDAFTVVKRQETWVSRIDPSWGPCEE